MARRTFRIKIPTNQPDVLLALGKRVSEKDAELGTASPLRKVDRAGLADRVEQAEELRKQAKDHEAKAQKLNQQAALLLGIGPGQTAATKETVLYDVTGARDELLVEHRGHEEALSEWSYPVVMGTAKGPTRAAKGKPEGGTT